MYMAKTVDLIRMKLRDFFKLVEPVKDIAYFLFLFLFFELVWKLSVHEANNGEQLLVLGKDVTDYIYPICLWTAQFTHYIIHNILGFSNFKIDDLLIYFDNSLKMKIIWGCTGIKQMLLFSFILTCYKGPSKKKLIFIPLSILLLFIVNILRLIISAFLIKDGFPEWFIPINESLNHLKWNESPQMYWQFYTDWYYFFHDGFFKWIYYDGVMFLLWLLWQEKFNLPYQRHKNSVNT